MVLAGAAAQHFTPATVIAFSGLAGVLAAAAITASTLRGTR